MSSSILPDPADNGAPEQPTIPGVDQVDDNPPDASLAARFEQFHQDNPRVYEVLCRLAREWVRRTGRRKVGINALFERTRWEIALSTSDPEFKINNSFAPFYSRLLMRDEPDLVDLFELRRSVADEWLERAA